MLKKSKRMILCLMSIVFFSCSAWAMDNWVGQDLMDELFYSMSVSREEYNDSVLMQPIKLKRFVEFFARYNRLSSAERYMLGELSFFSRKDPWNLTDLWNEYVKKKDDKILREMSNGVQEVFEKFADANEETFKSKKLADMDLGDIENFLNNSLIANNCIMEDTKNEDAKFEKAKIFLNNSLVVGKFIVNKVRKNIYRSKYPHFIYPENMKSYFYEKIVNSDIAEIYQNIENVYELIIAIGKAYADYFTRENLRAREGDQKLEEEPTPFILIDKDEDGNTIVFGFPRLIHDELYWRAAFIQPVKLEKFVEFHARHNKKNKSSWFSDDRWDLQDLWKELREKRGGPTLETISRRTRELFRKFADAREKSLKRVNLEGMNIKEIETFVNRTLQVRRLCVWSNVVDRTYGQAVKFHLCEKVENKEEWEYEEYEELFEAQSEEESEFQTYENISDGYQLIIALGNAYADYFSEKNFDVRYCDKDDAIWYEPIPFIFIDKDKYGNVTVHTFPRWHQDRLYLDGQLVEARKEEKKACNKSWQFSQDKIINAWTYFAYFLKVTDGLDYQFNEAKNSIRGPKVASVCQKKDFKKIFGYIPTEIVDGVEQEVSNINRHHIKSAYEKYMREHDPYEKCKGLFGPDKDDCVKGYTKILRKMNKRYEKRLRSC